MKTIKNKSLPFPVLLFLSIVATNLLYVFTKTILFSGDMQSPSVAYILIAHLIISLLYYTMLRLAHVARFPKHDVAQQVFLDLFKVNTVVSIFLLPVSVIAGNSYLNWQTVLLCTVLNQVFLFPLHVYFIKKYTITRKGKAITRKIILIGGSEIAGMLNKITRHGELAYQVVGVITSSDSIKKACKTKYQVFDISQEIKELLKIVVVDEIFCFDDVYSSEKIEKTAELCTNFGIKFHLNTSEKENLYRFKITQHSFEDIPFYTVGKQQKENITLLVNGSFEIILTTLLLFVLSPVFLVISLIIATTSAGPAIVKQKMIGAGGRFFYAFVFRTYRESLVKGTENYHIVYNITTIGKLLMLYKLQRLPQLFNVILGDMSITGTKPQKPAFTTKNKNWYQNRLTEKPGVFQIKPKIVANIGIYVCNKYNRKLKLNFIQALKSLLF